MPDLKNENTPDPREKVLYNSIEKWMRRKFHCFQTGTNLGWAYSRVDVLGVRDIGGYGSGEVETIGIEVKRGEHKFATACGQAVGYTVYANRVYLAQQRQRRFDHKELEIASHLGVGLIHIGPQRPLEVLSAPYHNTLPGITIDVLEGLNVGRCQLCQSFFATETSKRSNVSQSVRNAIKSGKAFQFFKEELEARKIEARVATEKSLIYDSRYLCSECLTVLATIAKNSAIS